MTALNPNQFAQIAVQGQVDLLGGPSNVIPAAVSSNASGSNVPFIAGQAVKLDTTNQGGIPKLLPLTALTDVPYGFVTYSIKNINRPVGTNFELALAGTYMHMTASAAITPGQDLEFDYTTNTVKAWAGVNPIIGTAFDYASGSGALIRVLIKFPSISEGYASETINFTATLAQINAGAIIIPGVAGKKIVVSNYVARVLGNFATGTSVELESTNGTPVAITTWAEAGLTTGNILVPGSSNTTLGAGFGAPLGAGDGVQIVNNGSAQTGGTSISGSITYSLQN
jgi:hypothetical protein